MFPIRVAAAVAACVAHDDDDGCFKKLWDGCDWMLSFVSITVLAILIQTILPARELNSFVNITYVSREI